MLAGPQVAVICTAALPLFVASVLELKEAQKMVPTKGAAFVKNHGNTWGKSDIPRSFLRFFDLICLVNNGNFR